MNLEITNQQEELYDRAAFEATAGDSLSVLLTPVQDQVRFFVDVTVGLQTFSLAVATGSSALWVPGINCSIDVEQTRCAPVAKSYVPLSSRYSSYFPCRADKRCVCLEFPNLGTNQSHCLIQTVFADGIDLVGTANDDLLEIKFNNFTETLKVNTTFGQIVSANQKYEHLSVNQIYGVLGLRPSEPSVDLVPSLLESLVAHGILNNTFSMCLGPKGGHLILGSGDSTYYSGNITYVRTTTHSNDSLLELESIAVGDDNLGSYHGTQVLLDSSAELAHLPRTLYDAFKFKMQAKHCDLPHVCESSSLFSSTQNCYFISNEDIQKYPVLYFVFQNMEGSTTIAFKPEYYFQRSRTISGQPCVFLAIVPQTKTSLNSTVVLGGVFMRQYYLTFDHGQRRIGFATPNNCGTWSVGVDVFPAWLIVVIIFAAVGVASLIFLLAFYVKTNGKRDDYSEIN